MVNKLTPARTLTEENEGTDQPTISTEAASTSWALTTNIPGQATRWIHRNKEARAAQQAFPDKRLDEKRALAFLKTDVIAWIKTATTGEQVPCTLDAFITEEEWQANTTGWEFRRFLANLNGASTGGYDIVAISQDKQRVIIRCDGPISIESLDWLIITHVVPTFAKVHYITDEQIEEGRGRGQLIPDVCVEIDPTKEQTGQQSLPPIVLTLSKNDEAYILSHRLLEAFIKDPDIFKRTFKEEEPEKKQQEPPKKVKKKQKQDPPKQTQKKEEETYDRVLTNTTWGFCQSTFDLTWQTTMKQGRHLMTKLKTIEGEEVYLKEQVPTEPVTGQEPNVAQPSEDNWDPKIEYVGDTSSDEETPVLEDVTEENWDEIYARVKEYQEAKAIEPELDQLRTSMLREMGLREPCHSHIPTIPIAMIEAAAGTSVMKEILKKQRQPLTIEMTEEAAGTSRDTIKSPKEPNKKKE